jgi:phage shock protein PspC (stress-responsive transcriptional regulator)
MTKLYRSRTDKKLAGICGGIGLAYHLDPNVVRIVAVFLLLATGVAPLLVAYIAGWVLLPKEPAGDAKSV